MASVAFLIHIAPLRCILFRWCRYGVQLRFFKGYLLVKQTKVQTSGSPLLLTVMGKEEHSEKILFEQLAQIDLSSVGRIPRIASPLEV
jgi:hypothetical protein